MQVKLNYKHLTYKKEHKKIVYNIFLALQLNLLYKQEKSVYTDKLWRKKTQFSFYYDFLYKY